MINCPEAKSDNNIRQIVSIVKSESKQNNNKGQKGELARSMLGRELELRFVITSEMNGCAYQESNRKNASKLDRKGLHRVRTKEKNSLREKCRH